MHSFLLLCSPLPFPATHLSLLGWSELALTCHFRNWTHCWRSGVFLGVELQKSGRLAAHGQQRFNFQKTHGPYNIKMCKYLPFTSKNNRQEENLKFEMFKILFLDHICMYIKKIKNISTWTKERKKNLFFIFYLLKTFEKTFYTGTGLTHVLADFNPNQLCIKSFCKRYV